MSVMYAMQFHLVTTWLHTASTKVLLYPYRKETQTSNVLNVIFSPLVLARTLVIHTKHLVISVLVARFDKSKSLPNSLSVITTQNIDLLYSRNNNIISLCCTFILIKLH